MYDRPSRRYHDRVIVGAISGSQSEPERDINARQQPLHRKLPPVMQPRQQMQRKAHS